MLERDTYMEKEHKQQRGLLNENDSTTSIPNLLMIIGVIGGLLLFSFALYFDRTDAYLPLSSIVSVAFGGVAVKAFKKTS